MQEKPCCECHKAHYQGGIRGSEREYELHGLPGSGDTPASGPRDAGPEVGDIWRNPRHSVDTNPSPGPDRSNGEVPRSVPPQRNDLCCPLGGRPRAALNRQRTTSFWGGREGAWPDQAPRRGQKQTKTAQAVLIWAPWRAQKAGETSPTSADPGAEFTSRPTKSFPIYFQPRNMKSWVLVHWDLEGLFRPMVRVPKMRHRGFFFFSRPTGLLQRSDNVM